MQVDPVWYYVKSALNALETLDPDTAIESAKSDLRAALQHMTNKTGSIYYSHTGRRG